VTEGSVVVVVGPGVVGFGAAPDVVVAAGRELLPMLQPATGTTRRTRVVSRRTLRRNNPRES